MEKKGKTAIALGATGLTGGKLLEMLLEDEDYEKVKLFSRSSVGLSHPKIEEYLGDMLQLQAFEKEFVGDVVFCCIGTTKSKTPDKEVYKKIDFGIPKSAAELARNNNIGTFIVISALGANAKSNVFYNRVKGEMEEAVLATKIAETYILQPSLIGGNRKEKRFGELVFKQMMKLVNIVLVGPLDKFRSISPENIAKCMVWLAKNEYDDVRIPSDKIKQIAQGNSIL